jgi:hypothetical protein
MSGIKPAVWRALSELAFLETLKWRHISKPRRFRIDDEGCGWYLEPNRLGFTPAWAASGQGVPTQIDRAAAVGGSA